MVAMSNSAKPRRPIIERTSTALLFLLVIFGIGVGIGALLGKLRPPIPLAPTQLVVKPPPSTDPALFVVGDTIEIMFSDIAGPGVKTTKNFTVDDKGTIFIPLLGPLEVRGHTAGQTEQAISQAYQDRNIVNNMIVKVRRVQPTTKPAK
jgi:protein involved in polysaccharide export with SLBB domain